MLHSLSFNLLTEPKFGRAKRIKVWANGESHCYEFTINPKNFRSWTTILLHITDIMQPNFGAIRKLIALSTMNVVDTFEDLDPNEKYIALGTNCKFKTPLGGFTTTCEREIFAKKTHVRKFYSGDINSKTEPFLMETKRKKLTIIYMMVNGRSNQIPQKVVFKEEDMKDWGLILKYLTKILDIPEGIKSICTIFGQALNKPLEFQHGYLYIAVPFKESFVKMDYASCLKDANRYRSSYTLAIRPASLATVPKTWCQENSKTETLSSNGNTYGVKSKIDLEVQTPTDDSYSITTI